MNKSEKMKILAVRSPGIINNLSITISPCLPIGLAYIVSAIREFADFEIIDPIAEKPIITELVPFRGPTAILGLTPNEIVDRVMSKPDFILISSMFSSEWPICKILINELNNRFPDAFIIGGGEHFTAMPDISLETSKLNLCVQGEGEVTIREFFERYSITGQIPLDISGTILKHPDNGNIIRNVRRSRVKEIQEIRYPAWDLFNVSGFLDKGVSNTGNGKKGYRAFPISASRGCPYACTFCSNPSMWGTLWKARPPLDVLNEMKHWIKTYSINHFDFCDLTAIVKKSWIVEFSELLIKENLSITWGLPSGTRSEALDEEVLLLLQKSGCNDLDYAPESGSEAILKVMKKQITKEKMLISMRACSKAGINSKANIIFGYPEETRMHILETYYFICQMALAGINDILVTNLSIYPGSELFERIRKKHNILMNEDYFESLATQVSINVSPCYSDHYGKSELYFFKIFAFLLFYGTSFLRFPNRLFVLMLDLIKRKGTTRLSMGLLNLSRRYIARLKSRAQVPA